jgi:putative endonuclease
MAKHNNTGKFGEQLAIQWVKDNDFTILATNWRYKRLEADIIAVKNNTLHIFEVKTKTNTQFGMPETSVSDKKIENMFALADAYIEQHQPYPFKQYDILAITLNKALEAEIFYMPDIYM